MKFRPFVLAILVVMMAIVTFPIVSQAADQTAAPVVTKLTSTATPLATSASAAASSSAAIEIGYTDWRNRYDLNDQKYRRSKMLMIVGAGAAVLGVSTTGGENGGSKLGMLMTAGGSATLVWGAVDFFTSGTQRDQIRSEGLQRGYIRLGANGFSITPTRDGGVQAQVALSF